MTESTKPHPLPEIRADSTGTKNAGPDRTLTLALCCVLLYHTPSNTNTAQLCVASVCVIKTI